MTRRANRPITRIGLVLSLVGTAMLRWVDRTPENFETVLTVVAAIAGLGLLLSVFAPRLLPDAVMDPAAMLAAVVFLIDGMESLLAQEQRGVSVARVVGFTWGAALVALAVMLDFMRERRHTT